jgi:hypothetical protein
MTLRWMDSFADGVAWRILTKLDRRSILRTEAPE